MEQLKFIVTEINNLCSTHFNMMSFDSLNQTGLLQVLCDVLLRLDVGTKISVLDDVEWAVGKITLWLGSIKYTPINRITPSEFHSGLATAKTDVIYPILQWLLANQTKVATRAHLAKFIETVYIPNEAKSHPEVQNIVKAHSKMIDEFWSVYNENNSCKKTKAQSNELKQDIKKMHEDFNNLTQRTQAQSEKLQNVPNVENFIISAKMYRNVVLQHKNISRQVEGNQEIFDQIKFDYRCLEDKLCRKQSLQLSFLNVLQRLKEEVRINKIICENQLPQEIQEAKKMLLIVDKFQESTSEEDLKYSISNLKNDVQKLLVEKVNFDSINEEQLGPFRNQAVSISNKKQEAYDSVKNLREIIKQLNKQINENELKLYDLVGGETLHGDQLKKFVAKLREKSGEYKKCRLQIQGLSGELNVEQRTLDVLKSIDSTINEEALLNKSKIQKQNEFSVNVVEARKKCKDLCQKVNDLKAQASQLRGEFLDVKKKTNEILQEHGEVKEIFEETTKDDLNEIKTLKEKLGDKEKLIEVYETTWKKNSQDLEKFDYIFGRLLDDLVAKADDSARETYLDVLIKKLHREECVYEDVQRKLIEIEDSKKNRREVIDFFKLIEIILMEKLKF